MFDHRQAIATVLSDSASSIPPSDLRDKFVQYADPPKFRSLHNLLDGAVFERTRAAFHRLLLAEKIAAHSAQVCAAVADESLDTLCGDNGDPDPSANRLHKAIRSVGYAADALAYPPAPAFRYKELIAAATELQAAVAEDLPKIPRANETAENAAKSIAEQAAEISALVAMLAS